MRRGKSVHTRPDHTRYTPPRHPFFTSNYLAPVTPKMSNVIEEGIGQTRDRQINTLRQFELRVDNDTHGYFKVKNGYFFTEGPQLQRSDWVCEWLRHLFFVSFVCRTFGRLTFQAHCRRTSRSPRCPAAPVASIKLLENMMLRS